MYKSGSCTAYHVANNRVPPTAQPIMACRGKNVVLVAGYAVRSEQERKLY